MLSAREGDVLAARRLQKIAILLFRPKDTNAAQLPNCQSPNQLCAVTGTKISLKTVARRLKKGEYTAKY